jgi:hypothetical protein
MKSFEAIDLEAVIEAYPSYVGMTWDGEITMIRPLRCFQEFDFSSSRRSSQANRSIQSYVARHK